MTPLGLLGPLAPDWLRENKVIGCPHPHIPSGKWYNLPSVISCLECVYLLPFFYYIHKNVKLYFKILKYVHISYFPL